MPASDPSRRSLRFGPFELQARNARLLREGQVVELVPKALDVLCYLAERPGELVGKDELLDAVWGRRFVSESVIKTVISTLRAALGDDPKQPRYIETAARRGYRFIGRPVEAAPAPHLMPQESAEPAAPLIARAGAREQLLAAWAFALGGRRRLVFAGGEPGIGKSTLVASLIAQLPEAAVAIGQCVEQYGAGEPYLPMLEALDGLLGQEPRHVALVRQVAPTWLVQWPWHVAEADRATLERELAGATPERMLRELGVLLDRLAAERPLLLVLEDLHWSDAATVRLLDHVARRRTPARLLIVCTYRPAEAATAQPAFLDLRRELGLQRLADEVALEGFDAAQVADYLGQRFPGAAWPPAFVEALQRHTGGLPLFIVSVVDELVDAGVLPPGQGGLAPGVIERLPVPDDLVGVIDKQIERLEPELRGVLESAALCGSDFLAAPLAPALGLAPDALRARLDELVRRRLWLREAAELPLADGRRAARHRFRHALYRHAFARRLGAGSRSERHARLFEAIEHEYGAGDELAAELAMHAEAGDRPLQAAACLARAARTALRRHAPAEALPHAVRGLALLDAHRTVGAQGALRAQGTQGAQGTQRAQGTQVAQGARDAQGTQGTATVLPADADADDAAPVPAVDPRAALEIDLLAACLAAQMAVEGYASPTVLQTVARAFARAESAPLGETTTPIWHAALWAAFMRGDFAGGEALSERLLRRARQAGDAVATAVALGMRGMVRLQTGRAPAAIEDLEAVLRTPLGPRADVMPFVHDLRLEMLSNLHMACEMTGRWRRGAEARVEIERRLAEGCEAVGELTALWFIAYMHTLRGEPEAALAVGRRAGRHLADGASLPIAEPNRVTLGWAMAACGDVAGGIAEARRGVAAFLAHGMRSDEPLLRTQLAEALLAQGEVDAAGVEVEAALATAAQTGERLALAETRRLRARILLLRDRDAGAAAAAAELRGALAAALAQGERLPALGVAVELVRLQAAHGLAPEAPALLERLLQELSAEPGAPAFAEAQQVLAGMAAAAK